MVRPRKRRHVCRMPEYKYFEPGNESGACHSSGCQERVKEHEEMVTMTVEEFEVIRLIDYEGLTQAECAIQMEIARTTVQSIYQSARFKISKSIVEGNSLFIDGGDYKICKSNKKRKGCCRDFQRVGFDTCKSKGE